MATTPNFSQPFILSEVSTPSAPASGYLSVYAKAGTLCYRANGGSEVSLSSGGGGITSLNALTDGTQTFSVGTSGTDFAISSSGTTHTFNIPNAGASARGLVTTGTQTFAGAKTFSSNITASGDVIATRFVMGGNTASMIYLVDSSTVGFMNNGAKVFDTYSYNLRCYGNVIVGSSGGFCFTSAGAPNGSLPDICLMPDAAGVLSLRNSTNAQTFRVSNTWTSSTSFETFQIKANSTTYDIGSIAGSAGGSNRQVNIGHFDTAGSLSVSVGISTSGNLLMGSAKSIGIADSTGSAIQFNNGTMVIGPFSSESIATHATWRFSTTAGSGSGLFLTPTACSGIAPTHFSLVTPADTTITASTESSSVVFNCSATRTWAAGALTTQREFRIQAPTYAFASASTITTASTLSISGAPTAGTNATITNAYALNVEAGVSNFVGAVRVTGIAVSPSTTGPTVYANNTYNGTGFWCSGDSVGTCFGGGVFMNYAHGNPGATCSFGYNTDIVLGTNSTYAKLRWGTSLSIGLDSANVLAQRNGTNAQTFRLYETYTSTTSFGTLQFKSNAGAAYQIGSAIGSAGGSNRNVEFGNWDSAGNFVKALTVTSTGLLSIRQNQWIYSDDGYERFYLSSTATYVKGPSIIIRNNNNNEVLTIDADGQITHVPVARSSGSPTGWTYTDPSHTGQTASTEATSVNFNLSSTKTFAAGALTTQRAFRIQAPTYAFASASTITTASTLSISGAPTAGTNATITNAYALNVESGDSNFAGNVFIGSAKNLAFSTDVILCRDAANVFALKNGTSGQTFRLYETYVGSTEFSLFQFRATSSGYQIGSRPGSTGVSTNRSVILGHFDSSGTFSSYLSVLTTGVTTFHKLASQNAEVSYTPSGTTQTLVLDDGNHQTLNLTSATGTVTATITVPSKVASGTIIVNQHASAAKGITWAVSSGTIKWLGTQPTWSSDATSSVRIVSWRWNGSIMYLASSEAG